MEGRGISRIVLANCQKGTKIRGKVKYVASCHGLPDSGRKVRKSRVVVIRYFMVAGVRGRGRAASR